ncbi:hypothetical protein V6N13_029663 [Hibiscus sabdariffa]
MNLICTPKILSNNSFPSLDFSRFLAIFYPKSLFVVCVLSQNGGHPHWSRPTVSGVSLRERRLWFRIFWRRFRFVSEFWGSVETTRVSNITRNIAKRLLTEVSEEVRAGSLRLWVIIGGNGASFWNYDCRFFLFFHRSGDATVIRRVVRRFESFTPLHCSLIPTPGALSLSYWRIPTLLVGLGSVFVCFSV